MVLIAEIGWIICVVLRSTLFWYPDKLYVVFLVQVTLKSV